MAVKVRIPTPLRQLTGGQRVVEVEGRTLAEVIDALDRRFPGIKERLIDGDGRLHRFVNVFVNEQDARLLDGLGTVLPEVAEVSIIPAMAGGTAPPPKASRKRPAGCGGRGWRHLRGGARRAHRTSGSGWRAG